MGIDLIIIMHIITILGLINNIILFILYRVATHRNDIRHYFQPFDAPAIILFK
ncbi:MAG: hypothetical protein ACI90V_008655 [Bacillariaceae sp.]|jgi:hypothetical protein